MTTVTRQHSISILRLMMHTLGITAEDLAGHCKETAIMSGINKAQHEDFLPRDQNMPLREPAANPRKKRQVAVISPTRQKIIDLIGRPDGALVVDVQQHAAINQQGSNGHLLALVKAGQAVRVRAPGEQALRYFGSREAADAYVARLNAVAEPHPEPARVALTEAEQKAIRIKLAKQAGAKAAPPPMGARTVRKPPGKPGVELLRQAGTASPPAPKPKAAAEPIVTEATKITRDTTKRPTARWQMVQEAPDERWPSFAATPPGTNPDTGRPWA